MPEAYDRAHRRQLAEAVERGEPLRCPVCEAGVRAEPVSREGDVSYVRRRLWLICTGCRRTAAVDVTRDGRP